MNIAENIRLFHSMIPEGVELVAVSKFHPAELILEAYNAGQRIFGESRVQELIEKQKVLPPDIRWHFIGHLQTNKVKPLIGKVAMIESIDSERLLELIDRESVKAETVTNVLLQVHVAKEETKFGFFPEELFEYLDSGRYKNLQAVKLCGLMGMASNTDDMQRVRADFHLIADIFDRISLNPGYGLKDFNRLSMGMSGDWQVAVEEGANIIRIGSAIFGSRY